jgi:hypothetical protein
MLKRLKTLLTQALRPRGRTLGAPAPAARRANRRARLRLESLEDRTAPATLTVTSAADTHQAGLLTLREAVAQANTDAAAGKSDAITFASGLGHATVTLTAGPLELSGASTTATETIDGGGRITVSGNHASRVFTVDTGVTAALTGLTVVNGNATNNSGGGIYNAGALTVRDSSLSGNFATDGGGVYNGGTLTISDSTLAGNSALYAGGIENDGTLAFDNSTLSGNSAGSFGGGLWTSAFAPAAVTLTNSTLTANRADADGLGGQGGGLYVDPGSTAAPLLHNTLIAGNLGGVNGTSGDDVSGTLDAASDYNLIGDGTGMTGISDGVSGNQVGTADSPIDARLGPLQDNGGPTATIDLLPGSPAVNAGDPSLAGTPDQRGVARRGGVNIGAYQASASTLAVTAPAAVTAGAPFGLVVTAVDAFGETAVGYTGTVTFATTDTHAGVVLPADYPFTAADAGMHTFAGVTTLVSAGSQTVTAADTADSSITGFATVTVNAAAATQLVLRSSANPVNGQAWSVTVTAYDAYGNVATGYIGTVHFASSDGQAALLADYTFAAADAGAHTFSVTFHRRGPQSLTVTDTADASTFGTIEVFVQN